MCKDYTFYLGCPGPQSERDHRHFAYVSADPFCSCYARRFISVERIGAFHTVEDDGYSYFAPCECDDCRRLSLFCYHMNHLSHAEKWEYIIERLEMGEEGLLGFYKLLERPQRDYERGMWQVNMEDMHKPCEEMLREEGLEWGVSVEVPTFPREETPGSSPEKGSHTMYAQPQGESSSSSGEVEELWGYTQQQA